MKNPLRQQLLPFLAILSLLAGPMSRWAYGQSTEYVYVVNELSDSISAFTADASTGALSPIPGSPFSTARAPHFFALHPNGKFAYVVCDNDAGASLQIFSIDGTGRLNSTGIISLSAGLKFAPRVDPSGHFLLLASGRTGMVSTYSIDATTGLLSPTNTISVGAFAWSFPVMDPTGTYMYVGGWGSTVAALRLGSSGLLNSVGAPLTIRSVPLTPSNAPTALILAMHPSGHYLYIADPIHRTIAGFSIAGDGSLSSLANSPFAAQNIGAFDMSIDPRGKYLYVSDWQTGAIAGFVIADSGALTPIATSPFISPLKQANRMTGTAISIDASGNFLYATNTSANLLTGLRIDLSTGVLTPLASAPLATGSHPFRVVARP